MTSTNKRDNDYYLGRMQRDHPQVYADLQSGIYKTITDARRAAGLMKTKPALERLQEAWDAASTSERDQFRALIGCTPNATPAPTRTTAAPPTHPTPPTSHLAGGTILTGRRSLTKSDMTLISAIMDRRNLKMGNVMDELGYPRLDASLGNAIARGEAGTIKDKMYEALQMWIARNSDQP
ncbi:hypothetical protein RPE78_04885 [Thioclava litoralis]|uniref:Death domain-containing protein n=1 Tax=Thioclava litoralis TaxID=3076557 RepID=A0ABZ1E306_9RHOB|nr:hypothetical protein RPE78_04885 [Thioclava sp. FTW29]